jgi:hypothetical protein
MGVIKMIFLYLFYTLAGLFGKRGKIPLCPPFLKGGVMGAKAEKDGLGKHLTINYEESMMIPP